MVVGGALSTLFASALAGAAEYSFIWAEKPFENSYEPSASYSYQTAADESTPVRVRRTGQGKYTVSIGRRVASGGANIQVGLYGSSNGHCSVDSWGGGDVRVSCFDQNGAAADRRFVLLAMRGEANDRGDLAYAWLQNGTSASYAASEAYRFGPGSMNVTRTAVGRYAVELGAPANSENAVIVTAYGSSNRCGVQSWGGGRVNIRCYDARGNPADTRASVLTVGKDFGPVSYAWNSNPNTGEANASYSGASNGSAQSISRTAAGVYRVRLGPEANVNGHVQVSAYNSDAECYVGGWGGGSVTIRCHKAGRPTDARFTMLALKGPSVEEPALVAAPTPRPIPTRNVADAPSSGATPSPSPTPTADVEQIHSFRVSYHVASPITRAEADQVLREATGILQTVDGDDDVQTMVELRRIGELTSFENESGFIQDEAMLWEVLGLPGDIHVVPYIGWCGAAKPGINGCAPIGGGDMAVIRPADRALEPILWAHEFGHNQGLYHRNDPNAVMNLALAENARRVDDYESEHFLAPAEDASSGVGDESGELSASVSVQEFVSQHYFDGLPFDKASAYSEADLPQLEALLADSSKSEYWANVAGAIGVIGGERASDKLIGFIQSNAERSSVNVNTYRAGLDAVLSLGYAANDGDQKALNYLSSAARALETAPAARASASSGRTLKLSERIVGQVAVQGLALSGRAEALNVLSTLTLPETESPAADIAVVNAITTLDAVKATGLSQFYRERAATDGNR